MSATRKTQTNAAMPRSAKPKLTIDTRVLPKRGVNLYSTHSAPVGTRQETGIPPIYQAVDRYCAKVAEIMDSQTWRSQRPGPHHVDNSTPYELSSPGYDHSPSPLTLEAEDAACSPPLKENWLGIESFAGLAAEGSQHHRHSDGKTDINWDGEAMSIVGIHPFSDTPGSHTSAFIISAAVPRGTTYPEDGIFGELQTIVNPCKRSGNQNKIPAKEFGQSHTGHLVRGYEKSVQSSPRSVTGSPVHFHPPKNQNTWSHLDGEEPMTEKDREIYQLMEQDDAIESVNFQHGSSQREDCPDPEDKQRFRGLLGRLRCEMEALNDGRMDKHALNDPAIFSFVQNSNGDVSASNDLTAGLDASGKYLGRGKSRTRSDSGYASPTTHSRPSTRAQSRTGHSTLHETGFEINAIQHEKFRSTDFELNAASKCSKLNPAAKEFSSVKRHGFSPVKGGGFAHHHVPDRAYFSPGQTQGQFCATIQPPGFEYSILPSLGSSVANLGFAQPGLLQFSQATLPQMSPVSHTAIPPPPGFGLTANLPPVTHSPGLFPGAGLVSSLQGLVPSSRLGLPGLANASALISGSALVSSGFTGPFHQQLPAMSSCNNPAHQNVPEFGAIQNLQAPAMPQLPPPAPPTSILGPTHSAPMPLPIAPAAPVINPIFRKNVPKPKAPNTTGQQYWEYWHELRRTFEPGYAQKSKQNQQKRYMKQQLQRNGDAKDQL